MSDSHSDFDVAILGGGLAGLTLRPQLETADLDRDPHVAAEHWDQTTTRLRS